MANNLIKRTHVKDWVVSSIYLPIDHDHTGKTPIHFETYIFEADDSGEITNWGEVWGTRYTNPGDMLDEHDDLVARIEGGWDPAQD